MENVSFQKEDLLRIKGDVPVADFRDFWERQYTAARGWKCSYSVETELWSPQPDCRIYRIRFTSTDGFSIGAWVVRPKQSTGGLLLAHGYGNPSIPPTASSPGRTIIQPCVRGLGLSQCKDIPWRTEHHSVYEIENPEKYVIVGGVRDLWIALTIMIDMFPDTADNIVCSGGSLGCPMECRAYPWDSRIHYGDFNVPTLGGRIVLKYPVKPDSAGENRRLKALESAAAMHVIDLCNSSAAAQFVKVPTIITPALCDQVVPPPGQFAVANSIPEQYRIMLIRDVGHAAPTKADVAMEKELDELRRKVFV